MAPMRAGKFATFVIGTALAVSGLGGPGKHKVNDAETAKYGDVYKTADTGSFEIVPEAEAQIFAQFGYSRGLALPAFCSPIQQFGIVYTAPTVIPFIQPIIQPFYPAYAPAYSPVYSPVVTAAPQPQNTFNINADTVNINTSPSGQLYIRHKGNFSGKKTQNCDLCEKVDKLEQNQAQTNKILTEIRDELKNMPQPPVQRPPASIAPPAPAAPTPQPAAPTPVEFRYKNIIADIQYDDSLLPIMQRAFTNLYNLTNGQVNLVARDYKGGKDAGRFLDIKKDVVGDNKRYVTFDLSKYGTCSYVDTLLSKFRSDFINAVTEARLTSRELITQAYDSVPLKRAQTDASCKPAK